MEATNTIIALVWSSFHVGQDTLFSSSSTVSSKYDISFATLFIYFFVQSSLEPFCTGGKIRTLDLWCWRPLLYQLSYTRKTTRKVSHYAPPFLVNSCQLPLLNNLSNLSSTNCSATFSDRKP